MKYLLTTLLLLCVFLAKAQNKTFVKVTADTVNTVTATISDTIHSDYSKTDTLEVTEYATIDSAFIRDLVIEIISGDTASFDSLYSRTMYVLVAYIDTIISDTIYVLHTYVLNITADTLTVTDYAIIGDATGIHSKFTGRNWSQYGNGKSIFIGDNAGSSDDLTDNANTFIGVYVGEDNTSGSQNTAGGYGSLRDNILGIGNTSFGNGSLGKNKSDNNTAFGLDALAFNTLGRNNTAGGQDALHGNVLGRNNTSFGFQSGFSTIGDSCVFLGFGAGYNSTTSNKLYIHNSIDDSLSALIYGEFDNNFLRINDYLSIDTTKGANLFVNGTSEFTDNADFKTNVDVADTITTNFLEADTIIQNGMIIFRECVILGDDDSLFLPDATTLKGEFWTDGFDRRYAGNFCVNDDGDAFIYNKAESTNCDNADTDGKLCLIDRGTRAVIKNRTGAEKTICYEIKYKQ